MGRGLHWLLIGRARALSGGPRRSATPSAPSETDVAMMRRALDLARAAGEAGEVPIGAVVYRTATGEVLGEGANAREGANDPAGHAELIAIRHACARAGDWRLNDCTLAVTLEPCPRCAGLIVNARLGRVVLGAMDPKAGAVGSLYRIADDPRLNHRARIVAGVLGDECGHMLASFFRRLREERNRERGARKRGRRV